VSTSRSRSVPARNIEKKEKGKGNDNSRLPTSSGQGGHSLWRGGAACSRAVGEKKKRGVEISILVHFERKKKRGKKKIRLPSASLSRGGKRKDYPEFLCPRGKKNLRVTPSLEKKGGEGMRKDERGQSIVGRKGGGGRHLCPTGFMTKRREKGSLKKKKKGG